MSNYPGNPSLSAAVRERVHSTYNQSVELYKQGRIDEVIQGCNLILQMDPLFDPAKKLLEKARSGAPAPMEFDAGAFGVVAAPAGAPAGGASLDDARAAMATRDFERVLQLTTDILTNDLMNEDARVLADEAREKIEAGPFIDQFVRRCEQSVNNGNLPAARTDLEKARALDPSHPGVRRIEQMIAAKEKAAPAPATSSFVVDTPAAPSGRSTAQASDFGFTFEEDKGGAAPAQPAAGFTNFSFDSPSAPAAETPFGGQSFSFDTPVANQPAATPGAGSFAFDTPKTPGNEFDFSTASIETTPDDQKKIDQYLSDGDKAFGSGNYQQAIDLWSRIFLIDVTNEAASERIERAKAKRREGEQQIEGILAAAVQAFERRDMATAKAKLGEVLQIDPTNVTAQDYMERIDSPGTAAANLVPPSEPGSYETSVLDEPPAPAEDMYEGPPIPDDAELPAPRRGTRPAPTPRSSAPVGKSFGIVPILIIVALLAGGGYYAYSKFMATPKADPTAANALLDRATQLSAEGKYDQAITTLQEIKPGDPNYDKALGLIADMQQKKARASASVDGRPAGSFFEENIAAGKTAFDAHDYVSAKKAFEQAMRVKPLPIDAKASYDVAAQQVAKLDSARTLFAERKYQEAIASLQPLLQADPQNRNIQRMIIDSHFNLGATALENEKFADAKREFDEVLKSDPNDELARRSKDLADRYQNQPTDLLYRIYVKYLPLRQAPAA